MCSSDLAAKKLLARKSEAWNSKEMREWQTALETAHEAGLHGIKETLYTFQQVQWLQEIGRASCRERV